MHIDKIDADAAGLDAARLDRIEDHLTRRYLEPQKIAGCQIAVARHGQLGYLRSLGSMDLERDRPVGPDTIWRIYSMTKPLTGVALMTLYEQGHFRLTDPVERFIPEWRDLKVRQRADDGSKVLVDPERPMNVRDLLMHMAGFGYEAFGMRATGQGMRRVGSEPDPDGDLPLPIIPGARGRTLESLASDLAEHPLHFHPGTRWLYSVSTDICARLVEVISGRRFDEYLRTEVLEPLGMVDTAFHVTDDRVDRFAALYRRRRDKTLKLLDDPQASRYREAPDFLSGGGGLVSTMADYLRFAQMLLNGGELDGRRILGRKTVELMTLNHLPGSGELREFAVPGGYGETGFDGVGFGLTMAVGLGPVATATVGSAGDFYWGGYASTIFWVDPAEDLVVVFMTQFIPSGTFDFRGQLRTIVYPAIVD